jgi:hypothetical protein
MQCDHCSLWPEKYVAAEELSNPWRRICKRSEVEMSVTGSGYGKVHPNGEQDGHKSLFYCYNHTLIVSPYSVSLKLCTSIPSIT